MSKFIITLMGYLLSFMLGSIFTVTYVDYKISDFKTAHEEKITTAIPVKSLKLASTTEINYKGTLLEEVTVFPIRDKVLLQTKKRKVESNTSLINADNVFNRRVQMSKNSVIHNKKVITTVSNSFTNSFPISFLNTRFLKARSLEAKARSPGNKEIYLETVLDLGISIINSQSNTFNMLKKDKKQLKALLQLLFTGKKYFRVKNDGTIIIKKHWYSRKKMITSIKEIINYTIPRSMIGISKDLAENYQVSILEIDQDSLDVLISIAYTHFGNFCTETGYQGRLLNFDLALSPLQRVYYRTSSIIEERANNLKQLNLNILLSRWLPKKINNTSLAKLKLMPSNSLSSLKEILTEEGNNLLHTVGICLTGNPTIDAAMPRVYRLTERVDLV